MSRTLILTAALFVAACASGPSPAQRQTGEFAPVPGLARPLANLAARPIIVTPTYHLDPDDPLGWAAKLGDPRPVLRQLDSAIVAVFDARGLGHTWYFPPDLERSYRLNSEYAADPYNLAEAPLRGRLRVGTFYGEPLATQLRTMIAMQEGARYVMLPVDLRFEPAGNGEGQAVLKLVLVDARATQYQWISEVRSDPAPAFGPGVLTSLAAHFADLVVAP